MINLAEWCIKHKQLTYFLIVLVAVSGIFCFNSLGRSEDPNFVIRQMVISCAWPGATAKEMEDHVTSQLEKIVQSTPDIDYITSYSRPGVCVVNVILKDQTPSGEVRKHWLEIRNTVADNITNLPTGIYGPYYNDKFDDVYGNIYAITGDDFSYEEKRVVAEELKRRFYTVPDVKKVELVGVQKEQINVEVSNEKLAKLGISLDTVSSAIKGDTSVNASGETQINGDNVFLRLTGLSNTLENVKNILITSGDKTFRLGDIAEITKGYPDPSDPKMYFNGKPAIGIAISMSEGGNNITLGHNLEKKLATMKQDLPLGYSLDQVANQPKVVENSISEFTQSLYEAILIVLVASLLTLGRQSGYVISVCIPLVLMGSMIGMYALGIDLHKVSLGSLIVSLGMLVDDAIVVVELMEVKLSEGWDRMKAASYAFKTCGTTLLAGTMITCCSFMPVAFSKSNASEFAAALFPVITITLLFSWFVSATVAPVLGYAWIKPTIIKTESYSSKFYTNFRKILTTAMNHRKTVVYSAILLFCISLFLMTLLKQEFFPQSVRPELLVELNLPEGSGIENSDKAAKTLTDLIKDDPDVENIATYVGKSAPRFILVLNPVQPRDNYAQLIVTAKDVNARKRLADKINEDIKEALPEVIGYSQALPLGPPNPYPVMLRVSAPTESKAKEFALKVRSIMSKNPHVTMTIFDWMEKAEAVEIQIDNDKLKQLGITRQTVANTLQASVSGYTVAQYYEGDQALNVVFRLDKVDRTSISDVENISIPTKGGAVPLSQLGRISYTAEENMIWRRNLQPTVTISGGIGEGVTGNDVTKEVWNDIAELRKNAPNDVTFEVAGSLEQSNKTLKKILTPIPLMLIIMMVLCMTQMQSMRKLLVVFCTVPMGMIGITLGLLIFNAPMGFMAELGSLALIGTIIRNSMVLMDQIDMHIENGMDVNNAIIEAAIVRYRPIMLAALTTVLGLIPMFASPFWNAMAVAMACGLTGATIVTLVLLPVLYAIVFKVPKLKEKN